MRALALGLVLLLTGCIGSSTEGALSATNQPAAASGPFTASSPAFADGHPMPVVYTCDGKGISPPLAVTGAPAGTKGIALIMADPDAPFAPLHPLDLLNFTHWLVWNVPVASAAAWAEDSVPAGARQGQNGGGSNGYTGPCPPIPLDPHRYVFSFYALDATLDLAEGATRAQLEDAVQGHVLADAVLAGVYTHQPV